MTRQHALYVMLGRLGVPQLPTAYHHNRKALPVPKNETFSMHASASYISSRADRSSLHPRSDPCWTEDPQTLHLTALLCGDAILQGTNSTGKLVVNEHIKQVQTPKSRHAADRSICYMNEDLRATSISFDCGRKIML